MKDRLEYYREKLKEVPKEIYIFFALLAANFPVFLSIYFAEEYSKILFVVSTLIVLIEACLSGYAIDKILIKKD